MSYEFKEHTADVKFVAQGNDLGDLFSESSKALKESICGDINVLPLIEKEIKIQGNSMVNLLYKFLEEFLALLDSEFFLMSEILTLSINKEDFSLTATVLGDNAEKYHFTNDVKAVTYSQMEINETDKGFECVVVLDV